MRAFIFAAIAALAAGAAAAADLSPYTLSATAGTGGLGLSLSRERLFWSNQFAFRLAAEGFDYDDSLTHNNIRYSGALKLADVGAYIDYRPFSDLGFAVSAGFQAASRSVRLSATPAHNVTIGGASFTPVQVGTLNGDITLAKAAPYLGIGWRQPIVDHVTITADLGAAFGGSPTASLSASTGLVSLKNLQSEAATLEHDARAFKVYPILAVGLGYRF